MTRRAGAPSSRRKEAWFALVDSRAQAGSGRFRTQIKPCLREDVAPLPQLLVLASEPRELVALDGTQGSVGRSEFRLAAALLRIGLGDPAPIAWAEGSNSRVRSTRSRPAHMSSSIRHPGAQGERVFGTGTRHAKASLASIMTRQAQFPVLLGFGYAKWHTCRDLLGHQDT